MSTVLSRSSPNCRRIDMIMPVLLFLSLRWDKNKTNLLCRRSLLPEEIHHQAALLLWSPSSMVQQPGLTSPPFHEYCGVLEHRLWEEGFGLMGVTGTMEVPGDPRWWLRSGGGAILFTFDIFAKGGLPQWWYSQWLSLFFVCLSGSGISSRAMERVGDRWKYSKEKKWTRNRLR